METKIEFDLETWLMDTTDDHTRGLITTPEFVLEITTVVGLIHDWYSHGHKIAQAHMDITSHTLVIDEIKRQLNSRS